MDSVKMSFDGGQELCFDKSDFEKTNFTVDSFLDRRCTNFETLRDDLGRYLKELRSAMIELINQDYSDFVNLSSNLIGLDKSISKLKIPLGQFKEEILQVKCSLDEGIDELTVQLQARDQLRQSRDSLSHLKTLLSLLDKMELALDPEKQEIGANGSPQQVNLDRVSAQLSQSLVCVANCRNVSAQLIKKHETLDALLYTHLDARFCSQLADSSRSERETITRDCLRIYAALDKFSHAETLVKNQILSPEIAEIVKEQNVRGSLSGVFMKLLAMITTDKTPLNLLINLTSNESLNKFEFLLNSFWPEVCDRLMNNTQSIFAPGNPEEFYVKYTETMKFLDAFEIKVGSLKKVEELRARTDYKNFMNKWNLPVYYQIRFQEIAGSLEAALEVSKTRQKAPEGSEFQLAPCHEAWTSIARSWQPGVFLPQLAHRFWKLTLQIMSRIQMWVESTLKSLRDDGDGLVFLASLHCDLKMFASKLPSIMETATLYLKLSDNLNALLQGSLDETKTKFDLQRGQIVEKIVEMGNSKGEITKSVTDIPRIYRRTNREVPTKAGVYVARFLQTAKDLGHSPKFSATLNADERKDLVFKLVSSITSTYLTAVKDLLTSVQKTEDSLRRLKQIRDKSTTSSQPSSSGVVSDDDKIRIQILQDCREYKAQVLALGIKADDIPPLCELSELVEKSVNIPKN